ncbi:NPC intracellular cholesterol transporter 1-like [Camellia sinensis]|uniref:NPC intracellular cholesterol transporter 1-like n=1 Tax=Camellia sinensis TaxID=4442 RepID=UPI0010361D53|nr:NPC intracellular cholesterol transporter 1-like [Camellia sinensis]
MYKRLPTINECMISRASLMPESTHIAKPAASWFDDFLILATWRLFENCIMIFIMQLIARIVQLSFLKLTLCNCSNASFHSDLDNGRPSTAQLKEKLPWFFNALSSADCAKGGHRAYTSSVDLNGCESGVIRASEFCTYHTPLRKQDDFVNSMHAAREFSSRVSDSLKIEIFPYSVLYIFFEQYLDIWETTVINIAIALGAVFLVCLVITSSLWSSAIIVLVLAMIVVDLLWNYTHKASRSHCPLFRKIRDFCGGIEYVWSIIEKCAH